MASRMPDIYLNGLAAQVGSETEHNDAATLGHDEQECARITSKTGIRQRPIVAPGELTSDLAIAAVRRLLADARCATKSIDALLVCTQTPDHLIPGVSSRVHGALDLPKTCFAVDINQGCSGFIYGLQLASAMLRAGSASNALLVNADSYSRLVRPDDLATRVIFGDAATASLLSIQPGGLRLDYVRCYSDGKGYDAFIARNSALCVDSAHQRGIYMDGAGILNFALRVVPEAVEQALTDCGLVREKVRYFLFHQANSFVIGKLTTKLRLKPEQVPDNCAELGNTVSASIPLLLQQQLGTLQPGDLVMAVGFGVGLSWGVALFEYQP